MAKKFSDIIKGRFEASGQIVRTASGQEPDEIIVNPMESVINKVFARSKTNIEEEHRITETNPGSDKTRHKVQRFTKSGQPIGQPIIFTTRRGAEEHVARVTEAVIPTPTDSALGKSKFGVDIGMDDLDGDETQLKRRRAMKRIKQIFALEKVLGFTDREHEDLKDTDPPKKTNPEVLKKRIARRLAKKAEIK